MKVSYYILIYVLLNFMSMTSFAQKTERDTLKVLFVGNSLIHYHDMTPVLSAISDSTSTKIITTRSTRGPLSLSSHWKHEHGLKSKDLIRVGTFDIVVLQGLPSSSEIGPDAFYHYAKKLCDLVKSTGAKPYFYLTWAGEYSLYEQTFINARYELAAAENDAELIRVGDAWLMAHSLDPMSRLYQKDGVHQSYHGAFLSACTFAATFCKNLPSQLYPDGFTLMSTEEELILFKLNDPDFINLSLKIAKEVVGK